MYLSISDTQTEYYGFKYKLCMKIHITKLVDQSKKYGVSDLISLSNLSFASVEANLQHTALCVCVSVGMCVLAEFVYMLPPDRQIYTLGRSKIQFFFVLN